MSDPTVFVYTDILPEGLLAFIAMAGALYLLTPARAKSAAKKSRRNRPA